MLFLLNAKKFPKYNTIVEKNTMPGKVLSYTLAKFNFETKIDPKKRNRSANLPRSPKLRKIDLTKTGA